MTNSKRNRILSAKGAMAVVASLIGCAIPASASDWGYGDPPAAGQAATNKKDTTGAVEAEFDEMKRQPARKPANDAKSNVHAGRASEVKGVKSKSAVASQVPQALQLPKTQDKFGQPDVIDVDKAMRVKQAKVDTTRQKLRERQHHLAEQWLELYSLVAAEPMTDEQRNRLKEKLAQAASKGGNPGFESIEKFWPLVKKECGINPQQQANYHDLFRALFRLELRDPKANPLDSELVGELIGPERVAVPENPPLTEDAVEAYADMTCFIYEQTHPGKTVNALDNRTVFVATMEHRYMTSASPLEKLAMSNFALKWGKFKVLYADADDADKEKLFKRISGASPESLRKDITNNVLDAVMTHGPWVHALTAGSDSGSAQATASDKVELKAHAKSLAD